MQTDLAQKRMVETSLLLKLKEKIDADGGWFVSVDAHQKMSVGRIPIELGGRSQKKLRRDDHGRHRPYLD